ncbi:MAG: Abi family protein [Lachnospiraceae bacterium]|nr:Abi family protein [Lachnospiraceae bacterium]
MKLLKTSDELISHMKEKGIKFEIVKEEDAKLFLQNNNYYMKLASYRANYEKGQKGKNVEKYINLDFAYLQELSTIDMHLRYLILQMCLDIEHALKTAILKDIENNEQEDGYDIIRRFITNYERCCQNIQNHKSSEYCRELIDKYYPYFPAWVFVELISFGDMVKLYEYYNKRYPKRLKDGELLYSIRDLRNATAHSNCLINKLHKGNIKPSAKIVKFVSQIDGIGTTMRTAKLSNKFLYDFTTLIYVYNEFINSSVVKQRRFEQLKEFVDGRVIRNKEYFEKNACIKSSYTFVKKIVDYMNKSC